MSTNYIIGQISGLIASIFYLGIFLFIFHNAMIRLTRFKSKKSKAVSSSLFLLFTGCLFTWMETKGLGSSKFVLPSHLFLLGVTWAEYYRDSREMKKD